MNKPRGRGVTLIGVDPGSTTGICVVSVDKTWLRGAGDATWAGMGHAIRTKVAYQIGREPKTFDLTDTGNGSGRSGKARRMLPDEVNDRMLPVLAEQPLFSDDGMRSTERFEAIMDGKGPAGGGDLLAVDAEEIIQVRQVCGLLDNYAAAAVVFEDFVLRTDVRSREVMAPDRLRSACQSEEILHGEGRVFFMQAPSMAKTTANDDRLKRADLYFAGMPHATDAARHVMTFLRRARKDESIRAAAWPAHFKDGFDDDIAEGY